MDLFATSYYKHLPRLFSIPGLWPYHKIADGRLRRIFCRVCIIHYIALEMRRIVLTNFDAKVTVNLIPATFVTVTSLIKFESNRINIPTMRSLLDWMKEDWDSVDSVEEIIILRKYAGLSWMYTKSYLIFLQLTTLVIALQQFWPNILDIVNPLNETRHRTFVFDVEDFGDPDKYYYVIALHTCSGVPVCFLVAAAFDLFYATFTLHACAMCEVLGYRFQRIYKNVTAHECNSKVKCTFRKEMVRCIDIHQKLLRFANHINLCYARSLTLQIPWAGAGWTFVLLSLFQTLVIERDISQTGMQAVNCVGYIVGTVYLAFPAQLLQDYSSNLYKSITFGDWYKACRPIQKLLIFLIPNCSKVLVIYFAHDIPLCSETFLMMAKVSCSYFMVLYSFYEK